MPIDKYTGKGLVKGRYIAPGSKLKGADLISCDLQGANLSGADLEGANLRHCDLRGASLRGANLGGAGLFNADLEGADLSFADLSDAVLDRAALCDTNFEEANLHRASMRDIPSLGGANFKNAFLSEAHLSGHGFSDPRGVKLDGANLTFATIRDLAESMALKTNVSLIGTNLSNCSLYKLNLFKLDLEGANFKNAFIEKCSFPFTNLKDADFENATLIVVNFRGANLVGANFKNAYLGLGSIVGTDLRGADLRAKELKLYFDDLSNLNPSGALFPLDTFHIPAPGDPLFANITLYNFLSELGFPLEDCPLFADGEYKNYIDIKLNFLEEKLCQLTGENKKKSPAKTVIRALESHPELQDVILELLTRTIEDCLSEKARRL